jgi:hypothetical protein
MLWVMNKAFPPRKRPGAADTGDDHDMPPHVAVAPGLLETDHVAIREDDDTDEDHAMRTRLLEAALRHARKG